MLDLVKPLNHLETLRNYFSPLATNFNVAAGEELIFSNEQGEKQCWFFGAGFLDIWRENNDIHVELLSAPVLLNLSGDLIPSTLHYKIVTKSNCTGFCLPVSRAMDIVEKEGLWKSFCHWQTYQMRCFEWRDAQFIGTTTYAQIRSTLLTMASWDKELRSQIGVINYIQTHTHISRSVIAEMLSALRKGNYIEMQKGKLIAVHKLPLNY
ncbi:helix-turn-helix domain-containing protein [Atlantibacter sp.]|uniref:helix-turn-helix domain-containing protein n=1 Tax=Atlantibacter sp. TaxID=1903473 RepID=UPI0028A8C2D2|nr:helix-turn-helix domain-containing protein [Atlantibacter sp.]